MVKVFDVKGSKSSYKPPTDGVAEVSITDTAITLPASGLPAKTWVKVTNDTSVARDVTLAEYLTPDATFETAERVLRRLLQQRASRRRPAGVDQRWHLGGLAPNSSRTSRSRSRTGPSTSSSAQNGEVDDDPERAAHRLHRRLSQLPTSAGEPGLRPGLVRVRPRSGRRGRGCGRCSPPSRSAGAARRRCAPRASWNAAPAGLSGVRERDRRARVAAARHRGLDRDRAPRAARRSRAASAAPPPLPNSAWREPSGATNSLMFSTTPDDLHVGAARHVGDARRDLLRGDAPAW